MNSVFSDEHGTEGAASIFNTKKALPNGPYELNSINAKPYYKWWYFDIETEDGDILTVVFHENHMFCCNNLPSVSFSLYVVNEALLKFYDSEHYPSEALSVADRKMFIGSNRIFTDEHATILELSLPRVNGILRVDGAWHIPRSIYQLHIIEFERQHFWKPILLGMPVSGALAIDGILRDFKGLCYHDCNFGIGYIGSSLSSWFWGRSYSKGTILSFLVRFNRDGSMSGSAFFLEPSSAPEIMTVREFSPSYRKHHSGTAGDYFEKSRLQIDMGKVQLNLHMLCSGLLDAKIKPALDHNHRVNMRYYRIMSDWHVSLRNRKEVREWTTKGLTEQMHF